MAHNTATTYVVRQRRVYATLVSLEDLDDLPSRDRSDSTLDQRNASERFFGLIQSLKPLDRQVMRNDPLISDVQAIWQARVRRKYRCRSNGSNRERSISAMIAAGSLYVAWRAHKQRWPVSPAPNPSATIGLEAYKSELRRSRDHSRNVWRMVAPLIPGAVVFALPVIGPFLRKVLEDPKAVLANAGTDHALQTRCGMPRMPEGLAVSISIWTGVGGSLGIVIGQTSVAAPPVIDTLKPVRRIQTFELQM